MVDRPRQPDVPKPAVPTPPDATKMSHADWQTKHERNMPQRPEKGSADTQGKRGDRPSDVQKPTPADATAQQRRSDAARKPANSWTFSPSPMDYKAVLKTVIDNKDIKQYRPTGTAVDMRQLNTDFAKEIKYQADHRKGPGGVLVDVRLRNVQFGKGSEAVAIQKSFTEIGRNDGIIVRVTVQDANGRWRLVDGTPLPRPVLPRQPVVVPDAPGGGGQDRQKPAPGPRSPERPRHDAPQPPPVVRPPQVPPPHGRYH